MRYTTRAMLSVLLVAWCSSNVTAEGSGSWWWPFGGDEQAAGAPASRPATPEQDESWMFSSPLANVSWPEFKLPHYELHVPHPNFSMPHIWPSKEEANEVRNAWAQPQPDPQQASPWQVVTDSAQRIGTSTRNAWHKTVDVLNPFDEPSTSVAQRQSRPSFWGGLFRVEDEKPQGPRTVTEWMAQERLDP